MIAEIGCKLTDLNLVATEKEEGKHELMKLYTFKFQGGYIKE